MNPVYYFKVKGYDCTYRKFQGYDCHTYMMSFNSGLLLIWIKYVSVLQ